MNPVEFVAKWSRASLPERAASQEHFLDLCRLLGQPTPAEHDSTGAEYTFEKGVTTAAGHGYADAWWRGKFAVEYKRKGKYPMEARRGEVEELVLGGLLRLNGDRTRSCREAI